jgi:AAA domain (dynein-related subfamily)
MTQWKIHPAGHDHDQTAQIPPQDATAAAARPLSVRVEADTAPLTQLIARALERPAFLVGHTVRPTGACTLIHRTNPMPAMLELIFATMSPFHLAVQHDPKLDVDAVLRIGQTEKHGLSRWRLRQRSDDPAFTATASKFLADAGFTMARTAEQPTFVATPTIKYGGADEFARTLVSWMAQQLGCEAPQQTKAWGDDDADIYLDLPNPAAAAKPLRQRIPVSVRSDTPEALSAIGPLLHEAGFSKVTVQPLSVSDDTRLRLDPGALPALGGRLEIADLVRLLNDAGRLLGIDWARFPLDMVERSTATEGGIVIDVPLAAMRSGLLRPWSRLQPGRYEVVIHDDDREAGLELEQALHAAGFNAHRCRLTKITEGFAVRSGKRVPESLQQMVRTAVDRTMVRRGASEFVLAVSTTDGEKIEVEFAAGAHRDGRLRAELGNPSRYTVKITAPTAASAKPLADDLTSLGFRKVLIDVDIDDDPTWVKYGGARPEVLDQIDAAVARHYGRIALPRQKVWSATDHDIFIRLPASVAAKTAADATGQPVAPKPPDRVRQALAALTRANLPARGPLLEVTERAVRVGDIMLEKSAASERHPHAAPLSRFKGFCLDQAVAETLHFIAQAVRGRYPAALEGPTAASKTWAISYIASLLGVGVLRVNLSAQSDVSELVGRFVPDTERPGGFRFQYGPAPRAMTEGAWLVMDEANLAPSEILERTNSILEMPDPTLTLGEFDGRLIADAHPRFRVLATWNSLGYAGRQELSPAFLDRFKTRICTAPTETDYRALGECLVHGRQPEVVIDGVRYQGGEDQPQIPELASLIREFDRLNTALARFQAGIATMAERGELRTRGPIAFTRRAYVDMLRETRDLLLAGGDRQPNRQSAIRAVWRALCFCHLERLDPIEERPKAVTLLTACGIGPESWELPR